MDHTGHNKIKLIYIFIPVRNSDSTNLDRHPIMVQQAVLEDL